MKKPTPPKYRTLAEFLNELEQNNQTVADWARNAGVSLPLTYALLRGHLTGRRGASRDVLKAMGVEPPRMFSAERTAAAGSARQAKVSA